MFHSLYKEVSFTIILYQSFISTKMLNCLSNFRVFFREYAHKIALTSSFSQPKCTKYRLAAGLRLDPLGSLQRSPRPPSSINQWFIAYSS